MPDERNEICTLREAAQALELWLLDKAPDGVDVPDEVWIPFENAIHKGKCFPQVNPLSEACEILAEWMGTDIDPEDEEYEDWMMEFTAKVQRFLDAHALRHAANQLRGPCDMPGCEGKGVIGNENLIDGKRVCDYCHAAGKEPEEPRLCTDCVNDGYCHRGGECHAIGKKP